jgi:hypothetical protein
MKFEINDIVKIEGNLFTFAGQELSKKIQESTGMYFYLSPVKPSIPNKKYVIGNTSNVKNHNVYNVGEYVKTPFGKMFKPCGWVNEEQIICKCK